MVHHHIVALPEDARDITIGIRIQTHAVGENAVAVIFLHGFFGVESLEKAPLPKIDPSFSPRDDPRTTAGPLKSCHNEAQSH